MSTDERQKLRQAQFKQGLSVDNNRRQRNDTVRTVRKEKKAENLKRRRGGGEDDEQDQMVAAAVQSGQVQVPVLLEDLKSGIPARQLDATMMFRRLLSIERNPPIEMVIQAGGVPVLINLLERHDQPQLQFEAAWALTNIASGKSEHTRTVIEDGAVPKLINLLHSGNDDVCEQAVWCLGNISGDSVSYRNFVLRNLMLEPLLQKLNSEECKLSMLRTGTWALSNLCRGKPQPEWHLVAGSVGVLANLIYCKDDEVLTDALWALSYLSDGPDERIQHIINAGISRRVVELLCHHSPAVQVPALRVVGNIVTGNDLQTQTMLNCHVLPSLYSLLHSPKPNIKKEACWTISNITAGNRAQIKAVIDANIIPPLIKILETSEFFKTRKEAAWAISNMTAGGSADQIRYLVAQNVVKPLCDLLIVSDPRVILVALEGLENILKVGQEDAKQTNYNQYSALIESVGGLDKVDQLQSHSNGDIYRKATHIIEKYYGGVNVEDENVAPTVQPQGTFGFGGHVPQMPQGGFQF